MTDFPRIRVTGDAASRSRQYGELAAEQIRIVRAGYERAFKAQGISWSEAVQQAREYLPSIERHLPELLREVAGIAEGSGLSSDDILTLNCRTEILHRATVSLGTSAARSPGECTSFAFEADRTWDGEVLLGQNWDWLEILQQGTILLEVDRPDAPNYVTLVEAGLLGKITLTAHGLALGLNTLVTSLDGGSSGIPFHFAIRALADSAHVADALETLARLPRASSGNYVLAGSDGAILNLETSPGGPRNITPQVGKNGAVFHANHFMDEVVGGFDLATVSMSDSYVRLGRIERRLGDGLERYSQKQLRDALSDHAAAPNAICCHPDLTSNEDARWKTIASTVLKPSSNVFSYTAGTPCESEWHIVDYTAFFTDSRA